MQRYDGLIEFDCFEHLPTTFPAVPNTCLPSTASCNLSSLFLLIQFPALYMFLLCEASSPMIHR